MIFDENKTTTTSTDPGHNPLKIWNFQVLFSALVLGAIWLGSIRMQRMTLNCSKYWIGKSTLKLQLFENLISHHFILQS